MRSPKPERVRAAESLLESLRQHSGRLVDQATLVSQELIRVSYVIVVIVIIVVVVVVVIVVVIVVVKSWCSMVLHVPSSSTLSEPPMHAPVAYNHRF
jgi:type VI protein secretion system component VasF